jgi:hypothetical protein
MGIEPTSEAEAKLARDSRRQRQAERIWANGANRSPGSNRLGKL